MQLVFLGTASCFPTQHRGVSCTALRLEDGNVWLFDCGEGSQIQLQRSILKPGRINKVFITHLHGDHLFGLPGLICTLGSTILEREGFVLEIFGPQGLRKFVRQTLALSRAPLPFSYKVHDLIPIPEQFPSDWAEWQVDHDCNEPLHPQELLGRDIYPGDNLVWDLLKEDDVTVKAGPILHRVPTFGFVVQENDQPGRLDVDILKSLGVKPGPLYSKIKKGEAIALPDGTVIEPSQVLGPPKRGRKVTILGDTYDPSRIAELARDSDILLHEATLEDSMKDKALQNGHSTPSMAAQFARTINAHKLVLFHFSQRYRADEDSASEEEPSVTLLVEEAKHALSGFHNCDVVAAKDLMEMPVQRPSCVISKS